MRSNKLLSKLVPFFQYSVPGVVIICTKLVFFFLLGFLFSSSYDGHDEDGSFDTHDEANGGDGTLKDVKVASRQIPAWLSYSTPDEFVVWLLNTRHNRICNFLLELVIMC